MRNESMVVGGPRTSRRAVTLVVAVLSAGAALSAGSLAGAFHGDDGHEESKLIKIEETGGSAPPSPN